MLGAIIGDIVGSIYEFNNIKRKPRELMRSGCKLTDDSVMTLAVADGIVTSFREMGRTGWIQDEQRQASMQAEICASVRAFGSRYPDVGYGGRFRHWLRSGDNAPYGSWGNGSAMRVSYAGWAATSEAEAALLAELSARITHNHPLGIKGAQVVAGCIYRLRQGMSKDELHRYVAQYYDMNFTLDEIRSSYYFDESCEGTVPQAIMAFLEGESFEDTLKLAISIGGDSDTLAAITGSLAEVCYPIQPELAQFCLKKLDAFLLDVLRKTAEAASIEHVLAHLR